jgi:DNA-binding winged helix-turn-helix (wHTH) protein
MSDFHTHESAGSGGRRRWRFADALFDEGSWRLYVNEQPVAMEGKPLALLRELLLRPGDVVTKEELLAAVWPGVSVVEASLTTAIMKLRRALGDDDRQRPIIETVPRRGYRLAIAVTVETGCTPAPAGDHAAQAPTARSTALPAPAGQRRWPRVAGGLGLAAALGAGLFLTLSLESPPGIAAPGAPQSEAVLALRALDVPKVYSMLRAGWNPNAPFDREGNAALNVALEICEWNPSHDRQRLVMVVRALLDGGAHLDMRNAWGDTPYSIAASPRYCGPQHPVTQMLHRLCFAGNRPPRERCQARPAPRA